MNSEGEVKKCKINHTQNRGQFFTFILIWGNEGVNLPWPLVHPSVLEISGSPPIDFLLPRKSTSFLPMGTGCILQITKSTSLFPPISISHQLTSSKLKLALAKLQNSCNI